MYVSHLNSVYVVFDHQLVFGDFLTKVSVLLAQAKQFGS